MAAVCARRCGSTSHCYFSGRGPWDPGDKKVMRSNANSPLEDAITAATVLSSWLSPFSYLSTP
ncbi:hypothetical protein KIN20_009875 [Parelaphostrongylus tenuis]|uniref:Uncharacterized protein n=1 Tax=Parelaphostrongylus tenuis TaxID=148309 RepID=A0AAD5QNP1_PARTN|nr:hypothetical protein KIN20_009875 [Parelaphostrongylus tenuis]